MMGLSAKIWFFFFFVVWNKPIATNWRETWIIYFRVVQSKVLGGIPQMRHISYQHVLILLHFSKEKTVIIRRVFYQLMILLLLMLVSPLAQSFSPLGLVVLISPAGITFYPVEADFSTIAFLGLSISSLSWEFCLKTLWPINSAFFLSAISGHPSSQGLLTYP